MYRLALRIETTRVQPVVSRAVGVEIWLLVPPLNVAPWSHRQRDGEREASLAAFRETVRSEIGKEPEFLDELEVRPS